MKGALQPTGLHRIMFQEADNGWIVVIETEPFRNHQYAPTFVAESIEEACVIAATAMDPDTILRTFWVLRHGIAPHEEGTTHVNTEQP